MSTLYDTPAAPPSQLLYPSIQVGKFTTREYQSRIVHQLRQMIARLKSAKRAPHVILQAPCGAGKSLIAAALAQFTVQKHKRFMFIVAGRGLVGQMSNNFAKCSMSHGVLMAGSKKAIDHDRAVHNQDSMDRMPIVVASRDTYGSRVFNRKQISDLDVDVMMMDECLSGSTLVQVEGSNGDPVDLQLSWVVPGFSKVLTIWDGQLCFRKVLGLKKNDPKPLISLRTESGRSIKGTAEHPVLVDRPPLPVWKGIAAVNIGEKVFCCARDGSNAWWETVVGYDYCIAEPTYDIQVEQTQCFFANGMLVHNCMISGTKVTKPSGVTNIEDIVAGDVVLSFDRHGEVHENRVLGTKQVGVRETIRVVFDDGSDIQCTPDHKIWSLNGWAEASSLVTGSLVGCLPDCLSQNSQTTTGARRFRFSCVSRHFASHAALGRLSRRVFSRRMTSRLSQLEDGTRGASIASRRALICQKSRCPRLSGLCLETSASISHTARPEISGFVEIIAPSKSSGSDTRRNFSTVSAQRSLRSSTEATVPGNQLSSFAVSRCRLSRRLMTSFMSMAKRGSPRQLLRQSAKSVLRGGSLTTEHLAVADLCSYVRTASANQTSNWRVTTSARSMGLAVQKNQVVMNGLCNSRPQQDLLSTTSSESTLQSRCNINWKAVVRVEPSGTKEVFDIEVENDHSFFANGTASSNCHLGYGGKVYQRLLDENKDKVIIGLSATPATGTGYGFGERFNGLLHGVTHEELLQLGFLVPPVIFAPKTVDLTGVDIGANGEYVCEQAGQRFDKEELIGDLIRDWRLYAQNRPTVVFAQTVEHSIHVAKMFNACGIPAEHIDASTPVPDRQRAYRGLADGSLKVVSNFGVMTTGTDVPELGAVVVARGMASLNTYLQSVGRAGRACDSVYWMGGGKKRDFILIDHAGVVDNLGWPQEDRIWTLDPDKHVSEATSEYKEKNQVEEPPMLSCLQCGAEWSVMSGRDCPRCGYKQTKIGKRPKFNGARLTKLDRRALKKRVIDTTQKLWTNCLGIAAHKGMSCNSAIKMFEKRAGKRFHTLALSPVPPNGHLHRLVREVWPGFAGSRKTN